MLYFLQTGNRYQPKNKLQSAIQDATEELSSLIVTSPEAFQERLVRLIDTLNPRFSKCTPLVLATWAGSHGTRVFGIKDQKQLEGHLISFSLTPIVGEFMNEPVNMVQVKLWGHGSEVEVVYAPAVKSSYTDFELEEMAAGVWPKTLSGMDDGNLVSLRLAYVSMAKTRQEGEKNMHLAEPFRTYPADVWLRCVDYVDQEIKRRAEKGVSK